MCNVLIIEDQPETIEKFKGFAQDTEVTFLSPQEVGLTDNEHNEDGGAVEEQLAEFLKSTIGEHAIDLVLLDTDLARQPKLETHSSYKSALRNVGMPVCRYQKGGRPVDLAMLPQLKRTIRDGASAIWMPRSLVSSDECGPKLIQRLGAISRGFKAIESALDRQPTLLVHRHSPTDVLAAVLGDAGLAYEFLGYASQNLLYFATPDESSPEHLISEARRYSTQLGYWLFNYILTFPGPILGKSGAAAYLNVEPAELERCEAFAMLLEAARYSGPFSDVEPFYWRSKLMELADAAGGDIVNDERLQGESFTRVDPDPHAVQAYMCMISGEAIRQDQAAANPDWVPSGASEAKIKEEVLDELGPLAGI